MSCPTRKPALWTLHKVSTRTSQSMPRRLTWTDTLCLLRFFCFRNHYSIHLSPKPECVGPDYSAWHALAGPGQYFMQSPQCWFSGETAHNGHYRILNNLNCMWHFISCYTFFLISINNSRAITVSLHLHKANTKMMFAY